MRLVSDQEVVVAAVVEPSVEDLDIEVRGGRIQLNTE
jgi:hypothetical protein